MKVSSEIIIVCVCVGILLSTTVWGLIALQVLFFSDFISPNTLDSWISYGFKNEIRPFEEFDLYITILGASVFLSKNILIGPFVEELYFRGAALDLWTKKYGYVWASLLSSLFFVSIHLKTSQLLLCVFLHSFIYCMLAIRFKHIFYAFIAHASFNFSMTIINAMDISGYMFKSRNAMNIQLSSWSGELFAMLLSMLILGILLYQFKPNKSP
jgi:membrane protease YdiL (CAAX protease family)